jgi:acyl-CoA oxidase
MSEVEFSNLILGDNPLKKDKWIKFLEDPVWIPEYDLSLNDHREKAYNRFQKIFQSGLVSVTDFNSDPTNIFTAHEFIAQIDPSTATKFTV